MEGIEINVNVPPMDLTMNERALAYVAWTIGAYRIDVLTYRGHDGQRTAADVLERCYADTTALADPDADGIFPIPEIVVLMRGTPGTFHPYADPSRRPSTAEPSKRSGSRTRFWR